MKALAVMCHAEGAGDSGHSVIPATSPNEGGWPVDDVKPPGHRLERIGLNFDGALVFPGFFEIALHLEEAVRIDPESPAPTVVEPHCAGHDRYVPIVDAQMYPFTPLELFVQSVRITVYEPAASDP